MKTIDGKAIAAKKLLTLKEEVEELKLEPALAVVLVGDDPASHLYVSLKEKAAKEIGVELRKYLFDAKVSQAELEASINFLNHDSDTHGIIVQLPLSDHLDAGEIVSLIEPAKDVDGFHTENQQKFLADEEVVYPVFPGAIMHLIESCNVVLPEKRAVVVGKSDIFDRVMTHALRQKKMDVEFVSCEPGRELSQKERDIINQSDVVVTACGIPGFLSCDMIRDGAIVIDGGISKLDGKTVGDVTDSDDRDISISPVPGGVGPVTIACLLENLVKITKKIAM